MSCTTKNTQTRLLTDDKYTKCCLGWLSVLVRSRALSGPPSRSTSQHRIMDNVAETWENRWIHVRDATRTHATSLIDQAQ
jgi:hypothetical protein